MFACFLSLNKDINSIIKIYITIKSQFETNFKKTSKKFSIYGSRVIKISDRFNKQEIPQSIIFFQLFRRKKNS